MASNRTKRGNIDTLRPHVLDFLHHKVRQVHRGAPAALELIRRSAPRMDRPGLKGQPNNRSLEFTSVFPQLVKNIEWVYSSDFGRFTGVSDFAPIFVIGSPRSGTTLVAKCLGAHPAIASADESMFLLNLWHLYSCWFKGQNSRQWKPLEGFVDEKTLLDGIQALAELLFRSMAAKQGKTIALDHTPWYSALVPFIRALFPQARFVHMVRDGRAVVASLANNYKTGRSWGGSTLEERTQLWSTMVQASLRGQSIVGEGKFFEMRYESLCADPLKELSTLLGWLDLTFSDEVLKPLAVGHAGPSRRDATLATLKNGQIALRPIPKMSKPRGWGPVAEARLMSVAGDTMERLGYAQRRRIGVVARASDLATARRRVR